MKERLAVQEIRKSLCENKIIILSGLRRVGKTVALQQLERSEGNTLYVDCRRRDSLHKIDSFVKAGSGLLLLDEFHYHPNCYHLSEELADVVDSTELKVVITSSSVHFTNVIGFQTLGGGRSHLIRMPFLTFLEFLYFTDRIPNYDDLSNITETDFMEYTQYHGTLGLPTINTKYVEDLVLELKTAHKNYPVYFGDLHLEVEDVKNAFLLLTYNLHYNTKMSGILSPVIGGKEMNEWDSKLFTLGEKFNCFSITQAVMGINGLSLTKIAKSLYFLLWSNLVVVTAENKDFLYSDLPELNTITTDILDNLFKDYQFTTVNPLLYTTIVNELQYLCETPLKTVLTERRLLGQWFETYIRGTYSYKTPSIILRSKVRRVSRELGGVYEVDIEDVYDNTLIECSVRNKPEHDVFFDKFYTNQICILATKDMDCIKVLGSINVIMIPYYKLAAGLDMKLLPKLGT